MKLGIVSCVPLLLLACGSNNSSAPEKFGTIALDSASLGVPVQAPRAFFYEYTSAGSGVCDTYVDDGSCRTWQCNAEAYTSLPSINVLDAGSLSVSGARRELAFARDEEGSYRIGDFDGTPLWGGGETLSATLGGSTDVPATTLSITAPPPLVVTSPVVTESGLALDVASDFSVTWQQLTTADDVYISLSAETEATGADGEPVANFSPAVDCKFAGNAGIGIVRSSLLSSLPAPPGLKGYKLDVLTFSYLQKLVGRTLLEFRGSWLGLSASPVAP